MAGWARSRYVQQQAMWRKFGVSAGISRGLCGFFFGLSLFAGAMVVRADVLESCEVEAPTPPRVTRSDAEEILIASRKLGWVGNQLIQRGEFDQAALQFRDAFNVLISHPEPPPLDLARVVNALGFVYTMLGKFGDARPAFELALDYLPADDPGLVAQRPPILINFAELKLRQEDLPGAAALLHEARRIHAETGVAAEKRVPVMVAQAEVALLLGDAAAAEPQLREALSILESQAEVPARLLRPVLSSLRDSLQLQGRDAEAAEIELRILGLRNPSAAAVSR